jgi:hypothetical protein
MVSDHSSLSPPFIRNPVHSFHRRSRPLIDLPLPVTYRRLKRWTPSPRSLLRRLRPCPFRINPVIIPSDHSSIPRATPTSPFDPQLLTIATTLDTSSNDVPSLKRSTSSLENLLRRLRSCLFWTSLATIPFHLSPFLRRSRSLHSICRSLSPPGRIHRMIYHRQHHSTFSPRSLLWRLRHYPFHPSGIRMLCRTTLRGLAYPWVPNISILVS